VSFITDPAPGAVPSKSHVGDEGGNKMPQAAVVSSSEPIATTTAPAASAAGTTVEIELGEEGPQLYLRATPATVAAGTVTFAVSNVGAMPHQMVVLKTDVAADKLPAGDGGKASEEGRVGATTDIAPGGDDQYLTFDDLEPGKYVLICNVPGHYGLGQYASFEVT
jgi:uncharacterized cupredoxin-like copper-binding protein